MRTARIIGFILITTLLLALATNLLTASVYAIIAIGMLWIIEPKQSD